MTFTRNAYLILALVTAVPVPAAEDWQQFRGPNSNTAVDAGDYPESLVAGEGTAWEIDLPGQGSSSPIVVGEAIYLTCEIDGQDGLVCYGKDGEEQWQRTFGPCRKSKHRTATGANPSPTTDGERVFAYYKSGRLVALDLTGHELWSRNLQEDFGEDTLWWDLGTSPVLTKAGVLVAVMQAGDSYLVTFDRATGEVIWKTPRQYERPEESDQAYTTPLLWRDGGRTTIVTFGADHLTGHDPATGEELFSLDGFNPDDKPMWRVIASPTVVDDVAVITYGRTEYLAGVKLSRDGDSVSASHAWTLTGVGGDVACPVIRNGRAYQLSEKGTVTCVEVATGEQLWSERLPRSRAVYFATPLLAGDLLYCLREDGDGHVARVDDQGLEVVGEVQLGDDTVVTPVPLDGSRLLVRTRNRMFLFKAE